MELSASDDSPPTAGLRSRDYRRAGGVPVYVMLPLDTVSREGELRAVEQLAPRRDGPAPPEADDASLTQSYADALGATIAEYPEQYFWWHRRWKAA